ncbi:MAG: c-type cytochrome [Proteobacteria bacterium]|nr:c-type cytochrome [Pseudomonadota bacterium]
MMRLSVLAVLAIAAATVPALLAVSDTVSTDHGGPSGALKALYARPLATPFPSDNPYSAAKAQLGERLFFDPRLSGDDNIACASCHNPSLSWGDGLPRGIGHAMNVLPRRTPTVLNAAWVAPLMWDGRNATLEEQAVGPMAAPGEMNQDLDRLAAKLTAIASYRDAFAGAFPGEGVTLGTIAKALATYERTIVSGTAPFDRWIAGDEAAIPPSAKRGFALFNTKANCATCHAGWNFTDNGFHDIGLPDADRGRAEILDLPSMEHGFKTPTLRDVARRDPYMHDGSLPTLAAVIEHYRIGGTQRPSLAEEIKPLALTEPETRDLIDFLATLTADGQAAPTPAVGRRTAR